MIWVARVCAVIALVAAAWGVLQGLKLLTRMDYDMQQRQQAACQQLLRRATTYTDTLLVLTSPNWEYCNQYTAP